MGKVLKFVDFGFKLAIVNKLMYQSDVLKPPYFSNRKGFTSNFDINRYIEEIRDLEKGDGYDVIEEEGYDFIPELRTYFESLEITDEMVSEITEICSVGGDDIYHDMIPFWDGEDSVFDVKSAEDVKLIPNLKKATLLFEWPSKNLVEQFKSLGVILKSM